MEININQKFKILFRKIFEDKCEISRYHADKLLKCLGDPNDHVAKHILDTPMFSDLIYNSIGNIEKLSVSNKTFTLELVTVLFRNELQFNKLQCQGFDMCMLKPCVVDNLNSIHSPPSTEMHLAFIRLVTVLLTHCSGMKLVKSKTPCEHVLHPSLHRKSAHLSEALYEYLTKLVWKLDEYEDETTLYEVLRAIFKPIHTSEYQTLEIFDIDNEKSYSEPIIASLRALLAIMSETNQLINSKCFITILKHCFVIESPMLKVQAGTRDPDIIYLIAHINFKFYFAIVSQAVVKAGRSPSDFLIEIIVCFVNEITKLMTRKEMVAPIQEFILNINIFWAKAGSKLYSSTFERNGQKYEMEDQFLWHLMLPLVTYVSATLMTTPEEIEEYLAKMGQMLTEHITKSGYHYKNMLQRNDLKKITIHNLKQMFRMKGLLKAKQAGTLFQSLFYLLQTFMTREDINASVVLARHENPLQTSDDGKILSLTLAVIKMLLTEHHIKWYDNLEIICLHNALMCLMNQNTLPNKQLLQALDLIELSTRRFLSPDMTLLVESQHCSTLADTTAAMPRYIQHEAWEVRDSALTLLLACTHIAFVKYVPLQKLILKNKLIVLASHVALTDSEYYVQVTALKCLAAAAKIESLWREVLLHNPTIYTQLSYILRHSPDGAVRAAAAGTLTQVFVNQHTSPQLQAAMRRDMSDAAVDDLHWEVQLAALEYWHHVIRNHLNDRGMIDGKFPSVTFSKEKRKIIVLDEKEVKRQLAAIMNDLSTNGCLTVLSRCVNEKFNIQVMERAYCISNKLVEILTCHHFDKVPENYDNKPMEHDDTYSESDTGMAVDLSFALETTVDRDKVIEEIVNTKTSDLIMNLSSGKHTENMEQEISPLLPTKDIIHPNKFLEDFKRTDYATIISNTKNWRPEPSNLSCLLDEILEDTHNIEMSDFCIE